MRYSLEEALPQCSVVLLHVAHCDWSERGHLEEFQDMEQCWQVLQGWKNAEYCTQPLVRQWLLSVHGRNSPPVGHLGAAARRGVAALVNLHVNQQILVDQQICYIVNIMLNCMCLMPKLLYSKYHEPKQY